MMMTSGRCSAMRFGDLRPVGHDVDQPDRALGVQEPADVLRDLGHVLDEEQANLIGRCHPENGTTRSRSFRLTRKSRASVRRPSGGLPRHEDDTVAAGLEGAELVVAGELLDLESCGLGEPDELVRRDEAEGVAAGSSEPAVRPDAPPRTPS